MREPLRAEHEAFRDAVLGKPNRMVTMREGLATLARRGIGVAVRRDGESREGRTAMTEKTRVIIATRLFTPEVAAGSFRLQAWPMRLSDEEPTLRW